MSQPTISRWLKTGRFRNDRVRSLVQLVLSDLFREALQAEADKSTESITSLVDAYHAAMPVWEEE